MILKFTSPDEFWNSIITLFTTPFASLSVIDFLLALIIVAVVGFLAFYILKFAFITLRACGRGMKRLGYKSRCSKITCPNCGKTLDKCSCVKNAGLSYRKRLINYKKSFRKK